MARNSASLSSARSESKIAMPSHADAMVATSDAAFCATTPPSEGSLRSREAVPFPERASSERARASPGIESARRASTSASLRRTRTSSSSTSMDDMNGSKGDLRAGRWGGFGLRWDVSGIASKMR